MRARSAAAAGSTAGLAPLASCGDPLVAIGDDLSVLAWNDALALLTGVGPGEALGERCFHAVAGVTLEGSPLCRRHCPLARDALAGRPVPRLRCRVATRSGPRAVTLATIGVAASSRRFLVHLLLDGAPTSAPAAAGQQALSARQREVLGLLAEGIRAGEIAERLGLSPTTVRNHIRAILHRLGCHSQIEAVAEARRSGML